MKKILLLLGTPLLLAGCIVSTEYGELWDSGSVDTNMVGQWYGHLDRQDHVVHIGIVSNAYEIHVTTTDAALGTLPASQYSYTFCARDVRIGTNTFMLCPSLQLAMIEAMTQTNSSAFSSMEGEASLLRYERNEKGFTFQCLNAMAVQNLIEEGVIEGKILPPPNSQGRRPVELPCVSRFDEKTLASLAEVFAQPKTWHSPIAFTKENFPSRPITDADLLRCPQSEM